MFFEQVDRVQYALLFCGFIILLDPGLFSIKGTMQISYTINYADQTYSVTVIVSYVELNIYDSSSF